MLTLGDLMTPAPVTIGPDATLRDAVDLLTSLGVSALPVVNGDQVLGLLSAQALIAFESVTPGVPTERDVVDVWEDIPATDDDLPPVEYFTELWDDAGSDVSERFRVTDTPEWDILSEHTVEEAMTVNPPVLSSTHSAFDAACLMRRSGSHGVLVIDEGRLAGIVTTMDITRAYSERIPRRPRPDQRPDQA